MYYEREWETEKEEGTRALTRNAAAAAAESSVRVRAFVVAVTFGKTGGERRLFIRRQGSDRTVPGH